MTRWLDADETRAWRGYNQMRVALEERLAADLAPFGLSMPDYAVLVHLSEAPEHVLRMHELASRMSWSRSRLSHHVGRMEARGLVERFQCSSDARGAMARLTGPGLAAITDAAPAHLESVRSAFIDVLTADEIETLGRLTAKVAGHLGGSGGQCPRSAPGQVAGQETVLSA